MRHSYKLALRAKGIKPLPPYHQLRTSYMGGQEILNPALVKAPVEELQPAVPGRSI